MEETPPPIRGPLNKINSGYDTFFSFWGWTTKCPRKPYTKFGPDIQKTCHAIRILSLPVYNSTHHCAMSYRASIRPNVVVPFHRWTTCGPRQLHTKFGPNIRTTSIPAGPLSFMFSHFTIQNFILQFEQRPPPRGPLNKINNRYDTIFSFWGWTIKCPRKPYTKFGPDI